MGPNPNPKPKPNPKPDAKAKANMVIMFDGKNGGNRFPAAMESGGEELFSYGGLQLGGGPRRRGGSLQLGGRGIGGQVGGAQNSRGNHNVLSNVGGRGRRGGMRGIIGGAQTSRGDYNVLSNIG